VCLRRAPFSERLSVMLVGAGPVPLACARTAADHGYRLDAVALQPAEATPVQDTPQAAPDASADPAPAVGTADQPADGALADSASQTVTSDAGTADATAAAATAGQAATDAGSTGGSDGGVIVAAGAATAPWERSIVCPVLYTHEVPSQAGLHAIVLALRAAGYQPTSLHNVDLIMSGAAAPLPGCLVLTFDDALYSQYLNALPVLISLQTPGVFFVMPAFADGVHRYMGAAQIAAVAQAGFEVEAHTCNHPSLPALARRNYGAFLAEIVDCRRMIENITGVPVPFLAYPDGSYDATALAAVANAGYRGAFTTRAASVLNAGAPYTLPRIEYNPSEAPANVIARLHAAGA
jgi:peptidoglycan/xylan/chitin deacetylase (PgdA/CDA1 family)